MQASRALDAYERFLRYTLIPSVFLLMPILLLDGLGIWTAPDVIIYVLMTHYLGGVLYSMVRQSRRWDTNA